MTATRQQRGQDLEATHIRVRSDLLQWLRIYAASQSPPVSLSTAMSQALETFRTFRTSTTKES